jgi:hypothetical protein
MAILDIEVFDGDVPRLPTGEKMLHEKITPGTKQAALLDLLPPKLIVEPAPVFLVQRLYVSVLFPARPQENVVPQKVSRKKWNAPSVKSFEDDLRIIVLL